MTSAMSLPSPVKRFLRFSVYMVLCGLLASVFWLGIPSPKPDETLPNKALNSERMVSRVYPTLDYFPNNDRIATGPGLRGQSTSMNIDFKLEEKAKTLALGMSPDAWYNWGNSPPPQHKIQLSIPSSGDISVSGRLYITSQLSKPWRIPFHGWLPAADAAFIAWWIQHDWAHSYGLSLYDLAIIPIRTRIIPAEKIIELWPDASYWDRSDNLTDVAYGTPPGLRPFLTIEIADDAPPNFLYPETPKSASPSSVYLIRLGLLVFIMIPYLYIRLIAFLLFDIAITGFLFGSLLIFGLLEGLALVTLAFWWKNGRPQLPLVELKNAVIGIFATARGNQKDQVTNLEAQSQEQNAVLVDVSDSDPVASTSRE
ncbi:hypothetical protein C8J56DRAFT_914548 [Mycena floridula]|nr:hypothetical protein C8J56DRAFT_914548 [Mycena floridula]